jgi:hypothetical protein
MGESTFFALAPLPLRHIKTGIQQVAIPLLVTEAATRVPGLDGMINSAIHYGGHFMAAGGKAIASQGLSSFGQAVSHHLPSGFGVRSLTEGIGQAITPVVLGSVERGSQALGELSAGILSGRTLINAAQQVVNQIGKQNSNIHIGDAIARTQMVIARTQAFLASLQHQISKTITGGFTMAPQNTNGRDNGETTNQTREQYVQLLRDYRGDLSLTYDKLAQDVAQNPALGKQYDQEVMKQALTTKKSPDEVTAVIAQGPHVQNQLGSDKQQNVSEYLAEILRSYSAARDIPQEQASKQHNNGEQPQPQQPAATPNTRPGDEPEMVSAQKSSREAEDYALGIVQMLDQRRLNVDRFQIEVNGKTVFKMREGDIDSGKTSISSEHTELIKKALNDPASLNGSVKITQGNQVLLHVADGRVLIDAVGITKQSAKVEVKAPDSPSKGLYERFSSNVNSNGLQATKEIATNALKAGVKREQVMDMLKAHAPSYQRLAQTQGENVAAQTIGKIVDAAEVKLMQEKMPQQQESQQVKSSKSVKAR